MKLANNIIQIFVLFLEQDPALLTALDNSDFSYCNKQWVFSLVDLHLFAQQRDPLLAPLNYADFKKLLYANPINTELAKVGGKITITENQGSVNRNRYALQKI
jgi:hypothetical protein